MDKRYENAMLVHVAPTKERVDAHEGPRLKKGFGDCASSISRGANDEDVCLASHVRAYVWNWY